VGRWEPRQQFALAFAGHAIQQFLGDLGLPRGMNPGLMTDIF
jgi:hypothetical protein